MNILYVSYFGIGKGGAEKSLQLLITEMAKKNKVYVASTERYDCSNVLLFKKFRYIPLLGLQTKYLEKYLIKSIKNYKINLIHANDRFTAIASILAAQKMQIPVAVHFRDYWFCCPKSSCYNANSGNCKSCSFSGLLHCSGPLRLFWDYYKLNYVKHKWGLLSKADVKIAISPVIQKKLDLCGIKNSIVIPNQIEITNRLRYTRKTNNQKVNLLYLGKLDPSKGIQNLLNLVDYDKVNFIIAGYGPLEEKIKNSRAKFVGWTKDTGKLYRQADIVVIPSVWEEPFGRVAIEAMSYGIPVIASDIGGLSSIVVNNKTGYLINPADMNSWKSHISMLVKNERLRRKMGKTALKLASKYNPDKIAFKVETSYYKAIQSRL